jgi:hypothetical protein
VNPRTGTKVEVKSTVREYEGDYSDGHPGRYQLWEGQHVSLVRADASGTAWYVFVLYDRDGGEPLQMRRMRPSTVTTLVEEVGDGECSVGWRTAAARARPSGSRSSSMTTSSRSPTTFSGTSDSKGRGDWQ